MMLALFVILYSLFAAIAWRSFRHSLGIVAFLLPSYLVRFSIGPLPTTLLEGMIAILTVVWILKNLDTGIFNFYKSVSQYLSISISIPLLLFFLASVISIFISPNWYAALGVWRAYILEPIIFFLILLDTARRDDQTINTVVTALAASAFVLSAIAVYQYFTGWMIPRPWHALPGRRVTSIFPYPNALGLYLAPIIVLIAGYAAVIKTRLTTYSLLLTALLSFIAIIAARSHGAIAATLIGVFLLGVWQSRTRLTTCLIALVMLLAIGFYTPWRTYVMSYITFTTPSGIVRLSQYQETWNMLRDKHWLFGAGLSGYKKTVKPYHMNKRIEIYQYPHTIIFNFWTELGLLGLLSFLWLIISVFRQTIKNNGLLLTPYCLPAAAALIALLVHGLVDVPFFKNDLAILFWIIVALILLSDSPSPTRKEVG